MGFRRFWLTMADKEIKVHRRVIRMILTMIQRAKNDRSVRRVLPVYDNGLDWYNFALVVSLQSQIAYAKMSPQEILGNIRDWKHVLD